MRRKDETERKHIRPQTPNGNDPGKAAFQVRIALRFMNLGVYCTLP